MFLRILASSTSYRNFFIIVLCIILLPLLVLLIAHLFPLQNGDRIQHLPVDFDDLHHLPIKTISTGAAVGRSRNPNCSHYDCFNIYKCGHRGHTRIQIFVYPLVAYTDEAGGGITSQISIEYYKILKTIVESPYYTPNPEEACLFVPSIDTLNQNRFHVKELSQVLNSLP